MQTVDTIVLKTIKMCNYHANANNSKTFYRVFPVLSSAYISQIRWINVWKPQKHTHTNGSKNSPLVV